MGNMTCRLFPKARCSTTCAARATTSAADCRSPCEVGCAAAGGINEGALLCQWIGLRENLLETIGFPIKSLNMGFSG